MEDHECEIEFRFKKDEIYTLVGTFELTDVIKCPKGTVVDSVEALCICLKRFAYPCRYVDLIPRFVRPVPHLCMVSNLVTDFIYDRFHNLLTNLDQPWLSPRNRWGRIDGTVIPICRPERNQRVVYNGYKRINALKSHSAVTPNGLIANLYGPVEGRRHDSAILAVSSL